MQAVVVCAGGLRSAELHVPVPAPVGDRVLVAFDRPVDRQLGGVAESLHR
ncbi:hypothetical protein CLV67_113290, partial [Actinoplanes italicus]